MWNGKEMSEPKQLFTYAFAVFESLWPRITGEAGDESPKLVGDDPAKSAFKYSGSQNEFSGYFKLIPLNILKVDTTSSMQGHKFSITMDSSLLYVEADPKSISPQLSDFLKASTLPLSTANAHLLVGIMEGYSRDAFSTMSIQDVDRYVIPGEIFSQLVSEMDTCTIFMINEIGDFIEDEIIKLYTGSLSRINELSVSSTGRRLANVGISPGRNLITTQNFSEGIGELRNFITNTNLIVERGITGGLAFRLYDTNKDSSREDISRMELSVLNRTQRTDETAENLVDATSEDYDTTIGQVMGEYLAERYTPLLQSGNVEELENIRNSINDYYSANTLSHIVPWSVYQTIRLQIIDDLELDDDSDDNAVDSITRTSVIDLVMAEYTPDYYSEIQTSSNPEEVLDSAISVINERLNLDYDSPNSLKSEHYIGGSALFANLINESIIEARNEYEELEIYNPDYITREISGSLPFSNQDLQSLKVPVSSHTPGFVLKGHVTSIETNSSVTSDQYEKYVVVNGEGAELPLKRHTIFYDQINREKTLFHQFLRYGLSNSSPLAAAIDLMETFAPDFIETSEAASEDIRIQTEFGRNAGLYRKNAGVIVNQGTVIYPEANSNPEDALLATPIHYIDLSYTRSIRDAFREVNLAEDVKLNAQRDVPQTNLFNVLGQILGDSSAYTWYIDEFGFMKVRYENSAAIAPSLTTLSPMIDDDNIINIKTSTSENNIFTMVEVVPQASTLRGPTEGRAPGIFGRATPPTVADYYALYQTINLDPDDKTQDIEALFSVALSSFNEEVLNAIDNYNLREGFSLKKPSAIWNNIVDIVGPSSEQIPDVESSPVEEEASPQGNDSYGSDSPVSEEDDVSAEEASNTEVAVSDEDVLPEGVTQNDLSSDGQLRDDIHLHPSLRRRWLRIKEKFMEQYPEAPEPRLSGTWRTRSAQEAFKSEGKSNASWGQSLHNYYPAYAFDVFFNQSGNIYPEEELNNFARIAVEEEGLEWGGNWTDFPDRPHFQVPNYSWQQAKQGATINWGEYTEPEDAEDGAVISILPGGSVVPNSTDDQPPKQQTTLVYKEQYDLQDSSYANSLRRGTGQASSGGIVQTATRTRWSKPELESIFQETARIAGSPVLSALDTGQFSEYAANSVEEVLLFDLERGRFDSINWINEEGEETNQSLYNYIAEAVEESVSNLELRDLGDISGFTSSSSSDFIRLLSTLVALGATPDNIGLLLRGQDEPAQVVQYVLRNARIRVNPRQLEDFPETALVLGSSRHRRLPYKNYPLQDTRPEAISADLFRYGLRIYRLDDYYLATLLFTKFRAEAIRRLHEEPIRAANISIVGNPIYKVGNTVLVTTREIEERKYNYINQGAINTLRDLPQTQSRIIFNIDEVSNSVQRDLNPSYRARHPFIETNLSESSNFSFLLVTEYGIKVHFESAYDFIHSITPYPVPVSAYVPLYHIYRSKSPEVIRYLTLLVQLSSREYQADYKELEEELQDSIIEITSSYYGEDYTAGDINKVINLLAPQNYHAYQYYIEQIQNSWSYGSTYTTKLSLNYGQPASVCHIPVDTDNYTKFKVVGYLLNKSPYMLYNDRGKPSKFIKYEHPLYRFSLRQQEEEHKFYSSSQRYQVSYVLDKIRKRIMYPKMFEG